MVWHRLGIALLVAVLALSLMAGVGGCSSGPDDDSESTENGQPAPGSESGTDEELQLVESKCSLCHTLDRVNNAEKDVAGWESTVARMRQNGAVMTDDEAQTIVEYLSSR